MNNNITTDPRVAEVAAHPEPSATGEKAKVRGKSAAAIRAIKPAAQSAGVPDAVATGERRSKAKSAKSIETKASIVLKKLSSSKGATIEVLMEATGWQAHSVRGFLSAVVRKKLGLDLASDLGKDGARRYRIESDRKSGS